MTDAEIIKALACCKSPVADCDECTIFDFGTDCQFIVIKYALDLINRQQEDIERLRSMNCAKLDTIHDLQADTNKLKEQLQDVQERYEEAQTKIEQWKEEANKYQKLWCIAVDDIETAKAEAYKEFAKKLKKEFLTLEYQFNTTRKTLPIDFVKDQIKWLLQEVSIDIIYSLVEEYEKGGEQE